jgi:hypothetical protein
MTHIIITSGGVCERCDHIQQDHDNIDGCGKCECKSRFRRHN